MTNNSEPSANPVQKRHKNAIFLFAAIFFVVFGLLFFTRTSVDLQPIFSTNPQPTSIPKVLLNIERSGEDAVTISATSNGAPITSYDIALSYPSDQIAQKEIINENPNFEILSTDDKGENIIGAQGLVIITGSIPIGRKAPVLSNTKIATFKYTPLIEELSGEITLVIGNRGNTEDSNLITQTGSDVLEGTTKGSIHLSSNENNSDGNETTTTGSEMVVIYRDGQNPKDRGGR